MKKIWYYLCVCGPLYAHVTTFKIPAAFVDALQNNAVVLAYEDDVAYPPESDPSFAEQKKIYQLFNSLSNNERYHKSGIPFIAINVHENTHRYLRDSLVDNKIPTIVIYLQGKVYKQLNGPFNMMALKNFIESNIGDVIERRIKRASIEPVRAPAQEVVAAESECKSTKQKQKVKKKKKYSGEQTPYYFYRPSYYYYNPYWYWDWPGVPYYGCGYPCGGCGGGAIGFGFGFSI